MGITVAIRGVDEELYRKVKAYAALEGRTIGSVVNEALRAWLEKRNHPLYEKWRKIKESREKSLRCLKRIMMSYAPSMEECTRSFQRVGL